MPDEPSEAEPPRTILGALLGTTDPSVLKRTEEEHIETKHHAAMGRVASNWSLLEAIVDHWSITFAGVHARAGLCLTSQIFGIGRKLDAFIALARLKPLPDGLVAKLHDFAGKAKGLGQLRDRTMHDIWTFDHPSTPERLQITAVKLLKVESIPVTVEELNKLAQDINNATDEFESLANAVIAVPPRSSAETSK